MNPYSTQYITTRKPGSFLNREYFRFSTLEERNKIIWDCLRNPEYISVAIVDEKYHPTCKGHCKELKPKKP